MKRNLLASTAILLGFSCLSGIRVLGQAPPNGYGPPPTPLYSPQPKFTGLASAVAALGAPTGKPATGSPGASSTIFIPGAGPAAKAIVPFDPRLDNHLKAPASPMGIFGRPIKDVERSLKELGAKPYSYAFGKHSRMVFSVYLLTLQFDRNLRLGSILIEPRPPFTRVEQQAQAYFMQLFLKDVDLNRVETMISPASMTIRFAEPASDAADVASPTEKK